MVQKYKGDKVDVGEGKEHIALSQGSSHLPSIVGILLKELVICFLRLLYMDVSWGYREIPILSGCIYQQAYFY